MEIFSVSCCDEDGVILFLSFYGEKEMTVSGKELLPKKKKKKRG
jgi:hypothetical protein